MNVLMYWFQMSIMISLSCLNRETNVDFVLIWREQCVRETISLKPFWWSNPDNHHHHSNNILSHLMSRLKVITGWHRRPWSLSLLLLKLFVCRQEGVKVIFIITISTTNLFLSIVAISFVMLSLFLWPVIVCITRRKVFVSFCVFWFTLLYNSYFSKHTLSITWWCCNKWRLTI